MSTSEREGRSFVRLPEVIRLTGLGRSTVYRLAQLGEFPRPYKLGPRTSGWKWGELVQWLDSREASSGANNDRGSV